jgi:tape measure domain-containing protein
MANVGDLVIELELKDDKLVLKANNAKTTVKALEKTFAELDKTVDRIDKSLSGLSSKFKTLGDSAKDADKAARGVDKLSSSLTKLLPGMQALSGMGRNISTLARGMNSLQNGFSGMVGSIATLSAMSKQIRDAAKDVDKLSSTVSKLQSALSNLSSANGGLRGVATNVNRLATSVGNLANANVAARLSNNLGNALINLGNSAHRSSSGFGSLLSRLRDFTIIGYGIHGTIASLKALFTDWQEPLIRANAEIERLTVLLRGVSSGSNSFEIGREAGADLAFIVEQAKAAPFAMNELANSFVKFKSVNLEEPRRVLTALSDAVAHFGGDNQALHRATIAIQQMAGKGVVSMEELRQQLGEAVPNAIQLMARSMGLTYQELVERVSKGQVVATDAIARMTAEFERSFGGSAKNMMSTWDGMVSQLQTTWIQFANEIGKAGYFQTAKDGLRELVDLLSSAAGQAFARDLGRSLAAITNAVVEATKFLIEHRKAIADVGEQVLWFIGIWKGASIVTSIVGGLIDKKKALISVMRQIPGVKIASNINTLSGALSAAATTAGTAATALGLFRGALALLGGPLTVAIGLIGTAAAAWLRYANAADKAARARKIAETGGSELDTLAQVDTERARLAQRQAELQQKFANQKKFAQTKYAKGQEDQDPMLRKIKSEMDANIAALKTLNERGTEIVKAETDKQLRVRREALNADLSELSAHYNKRLNMADDVFKKEGGSKNKVAAERYLKEREEGALELREGQKSIYKKQLDSINESLKSATGESRVVLDAWKKEVEGRLAEINELSIQDIKQARTRAELTTGKGKDQLKEQFKKLSEIEQMAERVQRRLAELYAENASPGATGTVEKLRTELDQIVKHGNAPAAVVAQINTQIQEIGHQEAIKGMTKATAELQAHIDEVKVRLGEKTVEDSWMARLLAGEFADIKYLNDAEIVKFKELAKTADEVDQKLKRQQASRYATNRLNELDREIAETRAALSNDPFQSEMLKINQHFDELMKKANDSRSVLSGTADAQKRKIQELYQLQVEQAQTASNPFASFVRQYGNGVQTMRNATVEWLTEASDRMIEFAATGKASFSDMAMSILTDIAKLLKNELVAQWFEMLGLTKSGGNAGSGSGILGSLFKGILSGVGAGFSGISATDPSIGGGVAGVLYPGASLFANGGIMTSKGSIPLMKYATGGIANSPQLSLFGEGRLPEAYVPLPDGRSIPVTLTGTLPGGFGGGNVIINVHEGQGTRAKVNQQRGENGDLQIDIMVEQIEHRLAGNIAAGSGALPSAMESTYGLNRTGGRY